MIDSPKYLKFKISGCCDGRALDRLRHRIDYLDDGLELIDYKSTLAVKLPNPDEIDLQIACITLHSLQRYRQSLQKLSLLYLWTGDKVSFEATPEHKHLVEAIVSELAFRLRIDDAWEATTGSRSDRYTYARYCAAVQDKPEPLPQMAKSFRYYAVGTKHLMIFDVAFGLHHHGGLSLTRDRPVHNSMVGNTHL